MFLGTKQRRVVINIREMESTAKDEKGAITKDVAVMKEKQRKCQENV